MVATLLSIWPLVLAPMSFVEASEGLCPQAGPVEQRVRAILGMSPDDTLEERARLWRDGDQLKVVVTRKDGSLLGDKALSAAAPCEELEALVSVVIATWISDLHPEFLATLPSAPSQGEMPAESPGPPDPEPPAPPPSSTVAPVLPTPQIPVQTVTPPRQRRQLELTAAAGVAASSGAAGLGSLGLRWAPEGSGVGAALSAHFMTSREEPLSEGRVGYWRWPLVVGPLLRLPLGEVRFDVHAGLALGWLRATGRDFQPSFTRDAFRGGGLLGLRAAHGRWRLRPFFEASGLAWAKTEAFVQRGTDERSVPLPSLELYLTLGVAWPL